MLKRTEYNKLPQTPGVYLFYNSKNQVIYIGKALSLKNRVSSYFSKDLKSTKTEALVSEIEKIDYIEVLSEVEALILEAALVRKNKPRYNISLRDDKSYLYIGITDEEFPRVLSFRKNDDKVKIKYKYGPFPSSTVVRNVLKLIRKMFPYDTQSPKSKRPCFYSHIGLCNPCPSVIKKTEEPVYSLLKKKYKQNISHVRDFLEGRLTTIITSLKKEMRQYSKNQQFEEAQRIKRVIEELEYVRQPYYKVSNFINDPQFLKTELVHQTDELKDVLIKYYPQISSLERIEGIDISNILGQEAVGSLVVFINGNKDPSWYRRFKIKTKGPNDVAMIVEVLQRRLKNKQWPYPNLFIIDGGKPQVSAATRVLKDTNIPFIGLAKREETIIIPQDNGFVSVSLTRDKEALKLLQKIRDESHRFAQKYHHLLRRKLINSV